MYQGRQYLYKNFADIMSFLRTLRHNILIILLVNSARLFSTMTIRLCIKFANINALFLATFSEPILLFIRTTKRKSTATYRFEKVHFSVLFFFSFYSVT